jgi:hypothetical protein
MVRGRHSRPAPHATMAGRHPLPACLRFRAPLHPCFPAELVHARSVGR